MCCGSESMSSGITYPAPTPFSVLDPSVNTTWSHPAAAKCSICRGRMGSRPQDLACSAVRVSSVSRSPKCPSGAGGRGLWEALANPLGGFTAKGAGAGTKASSCSVTRVAPAATAAAQTASCAPGALCRFWPSRFATSTMRTGNFAAGSADGSVGSVSH